MYTKRWESSEDEVGKRMCEAGSSVEDIAEHLGRTVESVSQRKNKVWGFKRQSLHPPTVQDFFDKWTDMSAYVFGFLYSDGHLRKDGKAAIIAQSHADGLEHLTRIQEVTGGSLYSNKNGGHHLTLLGKSVCSRLSVLGVPFGSKSLIVSMPEIPERYLPFFVRGIFDGDGSIHSFHNSHNSFIIQTNISSGSEDFLMSLKNLLFSRLGIEGSLITGKTCWHLRYSTHESLQGSPRL